MVLASGLLALVSLMAPGTASGAVLEASAEVDTNESTYEDVPRARLGGHVGYGVTIWTNDEGGTLTGVVLSVTLPAGASMEPAPRNASCSQAGQVVTCSIPDVDYGQPYANQPFDVLVAGPGSHAFTGQVTADGNAPVTIASAVNVSPARATDLAGAMWAYPEGDSTATLEFGEPFDLLVETRDVFPLESLPDLVATTTITLPAGLSFTTTPMVGHAFAPTGACTMQGAFATCRYDDLGDVNLAYAEVAAAAPGSYQVRVEFSSNGTETDPSDNVLVAEVRVDACFNLDGYQPAVPAGMVFRSWGCIDAPVPLVDVCPDLAGVQQVLPAGTWFGTAGTCRRATTGADSLRGDARANVMLGGRGNDQLFGAGGDDRMDGGPGSDMLDGGPGTDSYSGGAGNDVIRARDRRARERIACGAGRDVATVDRGDIVARDCEVVRRR